MNTVTLLRICTCKAQAPRSQLSELGNKTILRCKLPKENGIPRVAFPRHLMFNGKLSDLALGHLDGTVD